MTPEGSLLWAGRLVDLHALRKGLEEGATSRQIAERLGIEPGRLGTLLGTLGARTSVNYRGTPQSMRLGRLEFLPPRTESPLARPSASAAPTGSRRSVDVPSVISARGTRKAGE